MKDKTGLGFSAKQEKLKRIRKEVPEYYQTALAIFQNAVDYVKENLLDNKSFTYANSGVNIELGDDVSKILYNATKNIWRVVKEKGIRNKGAFSPERTKELKFGPHSDKKGDEELLF